MDKIEVNDIVRFKKPNPSLSSKFCYQHKLTGRVVGRENGSVMIDFGLYYEVYSHEKYLELIVKGSEAPLPGENE